jgi:uncharacterized membrane protein YcaP (DUF421 family)
MEFDWNAIFLKDLNLQYALEIGLRTLIMFLLILTFLRLSGKKGVRQLSIFEVAIIIALGSAAGDPMVSKEYGILPSMLVFIVIIIIYRVITYYAAKNESFESLVEGDPLYIIENGRFALVERTDHNFAKDEFFAEIRNQGASHIGQIETALLETNGRLSIFFYPDEKVTPGLPVLPKLYNKKTTSIQQAALYACTYCGDCKEISAPHTCVRCGKEEWVEAIACKRVR